MEKCDVTIYGIFLNFLFLFGEKDDKGEFLDRWVRERIGKYFLASIFVCWDRVLIDDVFGWRIHAWEIVLLSRLNS